MGNKQPIIEQQNEFELEEKDKKYLLEYLQNDNLDLFQIMCKNYDLSEILKCKNKKGESLLQQSLYTKETLRIFRFLLQLNQDLDHFDLDGNSPLHTAVFVDSYEAVQLLVSKSPHQLHQPNNADLIPLELAEKLQRQQIAFFLKQEHLLKLSCSKEFQDEDIDWGGFFQTIPFVKPNEIIVDSDIVGSGAQSFIQAAHLKSNMETKVAIKISRQATFFRDMFREIELLAQESVRHANLIPILGFTVIPGISVGILYPFSELGDLEKVIEPGGYLLSEHQVNHLIIGIARGLHHLHSNHLCHGKLQPKNILLFRNEEDYVLFDPKLINFGIPDSTPQNDVYDFGVTCWQICVQKRPTLSNSFAVIAQIDPILYDRFSKPLIDLIYQCLSLDPNLRPSLTQFIP